MNTLDLDCLNGLYVFYRLSENYGTPYTVGKVLFTIVNGEKFGILSTICNLHSGALHMISINNQSTMIAIKKDNKLTSRDGRFYAYIDEDDLLHNLNEPATNLTYGHSYYLHGIPYDTREKLFEAIKSEEEKMNAVFGLKN